jgi:hypothetical protein
MFVAAQSWTSMEKSINDKSISLSFCSRNGIISIRGWLSYGLKIKPSPSAKKVKSQTSLPLKGSASRGKKFFVILNIELFSIQCFSDENLSELVLSISLKVYYLIFSFVLNVYRYYFSSLH